MSKRTIVLIIIAVLTVTGLGASSKQPVGERINIFTGTPTVFTAGEPFHIKHGWINNPKVDKPMGRFDFELFVDGQFIDQDFVQRTVDKDGDTVWITLYWVHNFAEGMTGTVTFTGNWYAPCQYAVDGGWYVGTCATNNEKVIAHTDTLTVFFTPPTP